MKNFFGTTQNFLTLIFNVRFTDLLENRKDKLLAARLECDRLNVSVKLS